jgi:hypothetical protein
MREYARIVTANVDLSSGNENSRLLAGCGGVEIAYFAACISFMAFTTT